MGSGISLTGGNNNTISGNFLQNNRQYGIYTNSNNNSITKNEVIDNDIYLGRGNIKRGDNNSISGNTIKNNYIGIQIYRCAYNTIKDNTVMNSDWSGIMVSDTNEESFNNTILNNNVSLNHQYGISIEGYNLILMGNNVSYNDQDGIYFCSGSHGIIFQENLVEHNGQNGIFLDNCNNNTISNNIIRNNNETGGAVGIFLDNGENNTIFYNNLIGNALNARDDGNNNRWDNGTNGNYWDDYNGTNANYNGVGDVPYNCTGSANSTDNLPLIYPIDSFSGLNGTIHINGNQEWIDFKNDGNCTGSGTYSDPYIIEKLIINGTNSGGCILIENSNAYFIIRNSTFYNSGTSGQALIYDSGILLISVDNAQILNNSCYENQFGILLYDCDSNITISGNIVNNNSASGIRDNGLCDGIIISDNTVNYNGFRGIYLTDTGQAIVSNNTVNYNIQAKGIFIANCSYSTVVNNTVNNNSLVGIYIGGGSYENNITQNVVNNNDYGIIINNDCYSITILNNNGTNNIEGLRIEGDSHHNRIFGNNFSGNIDFGIIIDGYGDDRNIISGNILSFNRYGIKIWSEYNNITGNLIFNNSDDGIDIQQEWNLILDNNIYDNGDCGIYVDNDLNTISRNNISNNLQIGIFIDIRHKNNTIYNNIFSGNGINALDEGTFDKYNKWDNGSLGNFWDNYTGADYDDNGIGDTPYNITGTAGSQDKYPIWQDGDDIPVVIINTPYNYSYYGNLAPNFSIEIADASLNTTWYFLDNGTNTTANIIFSGFTGTIQQNIWETMGNGAITIYFYANDSNGNIGFNNITIYILSDEYIFMEPNITNSIDLIEEKGLEIDLLTDSVAILQVSRRVSKFSGIENPWGNLTAYYFYNLTIFDANFTTNNTDIQSMIIRFYYNPSLVNNPNNLYLLHYVWHGGSVWIWEAEDIIINSNAHYIEFNATHLSIFCLAEIEMDEDVPDDVPFWVFIMDNLLIIIILSAIGVSVPTVYVVISRKKEKANKIQITKKKVDFNKLPKKVKQEAYTLYLEKKALEKRKALVKRTWKPAKSFDMEEITFTSPADLNNARVTTLSEDFLDRINQFKWEPKEKEEFINEMLALTPDKREQILDKMEGKGTVGKPPERAWKSEDLQEIISLTIYKLVYL